MLLSLFILAFSSSIDSLGIGITYGIKNTKISCLSKIILFCISIGINFISICCGKFLNTLLSAGFANIIGNIRIAISLDSLKTVKDDYEMVLNELLKWVNYYYENKNLDIITHDDSLKIHNLLDKIRDELIFNRQIGMESMLSDDILIRYEVIIKTINDERSN